MSAVIIDGKAIAERMKSPIIEAIAGGMRPKLGILSPSTPASLAYLGAQVRLAESLGIATDVVRCDEDASQEYAESAILHWNNDPETHGIFILQPFPEGIDIERLAMLIHPMKDLECIHPYDSSLRYFSKSPTGSCTALAIMEVLDSIRPNIVGAEAVVVGASKIVGRPTSQLLLDRNATITICHKATADGKMLQTHIARAEILIVAVGKAGCIPGHWIRRNAIVIDVGVNHIGNKVVGDVEFEPAFERASYIAPARGGVGPITAMIGMRQLIIAYQLQHERR